MRKVEKRTSVKEYEHLVSRTCDLCGAEAAGEGWDSTKWNVNETEVEIEVRSKRGTEYPEGGCGTKIVIDICPKCFMGKLIPWVNSQGANVKSVEWDW